MSVRPSAWNNLPPTEQISWNFMFGYFSKMCGKIQILLNSAKNIGCLTWIPGALHEHRMLCINTGCFTWIPVVLHEYRLLYTNTGFFALIQGALHEHRVLYMNTGCFTWTPGTLHEYRVLYMDTGCFTWTLGALHEYRVLYMNTGCFTWTPGALHEYRLLYTNTGFFALIPGALHEYRVFYMNTGCFTWIRLWYLAQFFLKWEMFQTKAVEKVNTQFIFNNVFPKIVLLSDGVEKWSGARQAPDDNTIWRIRFSCWITEATDI